MPGFNSEAQAIAAMGFVVARVNVRGTAGFGARHLLAIRDGVDTLPVKDMRSALDWVAARIPIDRNRVAVLGQGLGGYMAFRAVQLQPEVFRLAINLNGPVDLDAWVHESEQTPLGQSLSSLVRVEGRVTYRSQLRSAFIENGKSLSKSISVIEHASRFQRPVLLIENPAQEDTTPGAAQTLLERLGDRPKSMATSSDPKPYLDYIQIDDAFAAGDPTVRAKVFGKIEAFLNEYLDSAAIPRAGN